MMEVEHLASGANKACRHKEAAWAGDPHYNVIHHRGTGSPPSAHTSGFWVGGRLLTSWWRRKKPKLGSQMDHFSMKCKPKMDCCYTTDLKGSDKRKPYQGQNFGWCAWPFYLYGKRSSSRLDSMWIHEQWWMDRLVRHQERERTD